MLVLRFLLILGAIACLAALGVYLLKRDTRYLRFAWQLFKFFLVMGLVIAIALAIGRILLM